jgi:hypothetical protein
MLKTKQIFILLITLTMLVTLSGNLFAAQISIGEEVIDLPEGWTVITQQNKEEAFKEYPFLSKVQNFGLILVKASNSEIFTEAQEEKNGEKMLKNYPAYVVIRQAKTHGQPAEKLLDKPIAQMKESVEQTYQNHQFITDKAVDVGEYKGHRLDYEVGNMNFKNFFYVDNDHLTAFLSTNTKLQKADQEIEDLYEKVVKAYK